MHPAKCATDSQNRANGGFATVSIPLGLCSTVIGMSIYLEKYEICDHKCYAVTTTPYFVGYMRRTGKPWTMLSLCGKLEETVDRAFAAWSIL